MIDVNYFSQFIVKGLYVFDVMTIKTSDKHYHTPFPPDRSGGLSADKSDRGKTMQELSDKVKAAINKYNERESKKKEQEQAKDAENLGMDEKIARKLKPLIRELMHKGR